MAGKLRYASPRQAENFLDTDSFDKLRTGNTAFNCHKPWPTHCRGRQNRQPLERNAPLPVNISSQQTPFNVAGFFSQEYFCAISAGAQKDGPPVLLHL